MSEYCRLCAESYPLVKLKDITQLQCEKLDEIILKLLKIDVHELDAVTKSVCTVCCLTTIELEKFVSNVESAQKRLQEIGCVLEKVKDDIKDLEVDYLLTDETKVLEDELPESRSGFEDDVQSDASDTRPQQNNQKVGSKVVTSSRNKRYKYIWECYHCSTFYPTANDLSTHFDSFHRITVEYTCSECRAIIVDLTEFRRHMTEEHELTQYDETHRGRFQCDNCDYSTNHSTNLKQHQLTHTGIRNYSCDLCDKSFFTKQKLRLHSLSHVKGDKAHRKAKTGVRKDRGFPPFYCFYCKPRLRISSESQFNSHFDNVHPGETTKFCCLQCLDAFEDRKQYIDHYKTHTKQYRCDFCGKEFSHQTNLKTHRYIHTGEKNFQCDTCDSKFYTKQHLESHKLSHFKPLFKCDICPKVCSSDSFLKRHQRTHIALEEKLNHECDVCQKRFVSLKGLLGHKKTHDENSISAEGEFICEKCAKPFRTKYSYVAHYNYSHPDDNTPCTCEKCGKKLKNDATLKKHMKYCHTTEKPFVCDTCGSKFRERGSLKRHSRIHTGELPYQCEVCKKCFRVSYALKIHTRQHTGERPYSCSTCYMFFSNVSNYKKHMKVRHGKNTTKKNLTDSA